MQHTSKLREYIFETEFLKNLFTLALPIILQNFLNSFVNILDTIMIGRLGSIEIAAVGLGNQLFFLLNLVLYGVASGSLVFTSQFWGKNDLSGLRKAFGLSMCIAIFLGSIFTLVCFFMPTKILSFYSKDKDVILVGVKYLRIVCFSFIPFGISFIFIFTLRAIEQVRVAVTVTMISLTVNLILNTVLIFGFLGFPAFGVIGAATATVCARITELIAFIVITKKKHYPILGKLKEHFAFSCKFLITFFIIVLPVIFNESIWSLGITFHHKIFAQLSTFAYAAFSITNTVSQLTWVVLVGLGNSISILIGKKIGEGEYNTAKIYANRIAIISPLVASIIGMILIPISFLLKYIFNVEPDVIAQARYFFIILAICYPLKAFNMSMIVGVIRSGGDTKFGAIYDTLFMWIISIPLAWSLSVYTKLPAWFIYLCLFADEPIKVCVGFWRLRSGKWLHRVVE